MTPETSLNFHGGFFHVWVSEIDVDFLFFLFLFVLWKGTRLDGY
jgi:hypothetical protein